MRARSLDDDLGIRRKERRVAPGVIAVLVRVQHVADRLFGHGFDLREDLRAILRKFVVHQNHAFAGGHHGDVAAAADDDIQIFRHLLHGELSRRLVLRPANPESRAEQGRDGYTCQKDFRRKHVLWIYHVPERERKFRSFSSAHARPAVRLT